MTMLRLLLVDDDPDFREHLVLLGESEFEVVAADGYESGLAALHRDSFDAVLLDIDLGRGKSGLDLLDQVVRLDPDLPVIMVSADGQPETIVAAMRAGALDYVAKDADLELLKLKIEKRLEEIAWRRHARAIQVSDEPMVGSSPAMQRLREEIRRVARSTVRVLIRGETGTGKELVAEAIHAASPRARQRLVRASGASGSDELFESQMFGYEKGAFTGATERRRGLLELAGGGTLFLDEIGKMSLGKQAKLLRVFEDAEFTRIGGSRMLPSSFRLVTASNENLETAIEAGEFAEDFFHRIREYELTVPPLRERREDVAELAAALLDRFCRKGDLLTPVVSPDAVDVLAAHDWPGNVRQLDNVLKRAAILGGGASLGAEPVRRALEAESRRERRDGATAPSAAAANGKSYRAAHDDFDRDFLRRTLDAHGGNVTEAAGAIGMSRTRLYERLKALGLSG